MFDGLRERFGEVFDRLTGRGVLTSEDVEAALLDIRRALLDADVALDVVRTFLEAVRKRALGSEVLTSVTPGQMVVKIVNDALVEALGSHSVGLELTGAPPHILLLVGLQGSGKTTTTAKLAFRLQKQEKKKVLMASVDIYRPAAREQLATLGRQTEVAVFAGEGLNDPLEIALGARSEALRGGYDLLLLDTAGRTQLDEAMMAEARTLGARLKPNETLLVADALTGQDAVRTARAFDEALGLTGLILTRIDGDSRGGAALSMRAVTGKPIKFLGVGEKWDALEVFHPDRLAGRILGLGDIVSLVEKASQEVDAARAARLARRVGRGVFDLSDLAMQLRQTQNMGGFAQALKFLPGARKLGALASSEDRQVARQIALIDSMTPLERRAPKILNHRRKQRIIKGAGATPSELNKLLKVHQHLAKTMKKLSSNPALARQLAATVSQGTQMPDAEPGAGAVSLPDFGLSSPTDMPTLPGAPGQAFPALPPSGGAGEALDGTSDTLSQLFDTVGAGRGSFGSPTMVRSGGAKRPKRKKRHKRR